MACFCYGVVTMPVGNHILWWWGALLQDAGEAYDELLKQAVLLVTAPVAHALLQPWLLFVILETPPSLDSHSPRDYKSSLPLPALGSFPFLPGSYNPAQILVYNSFHRLFSITHFSVIYFLILTLIIFYNICKTEKESRAIWIYRSKCT